MEGLDDGLEEEGESRQRGTIVSKYARKNTNIEIVCKNCGKRSIVHSCKAIFCSKECAIKWRNGHRKRFRDDAQPRLCDVCGRPFKPFSKRSRFCSKECLAIFNHFNAVAKKTARNRARIGGDRKCLYCGTTFTPRHHRHVCCSAGCYNNWKLKQKLELQKANGGLSMSIEDALKRRIGEKESKPIVSVEDRVKYNTEWHECPECGRKFMARNFRQYCCSRECGIKYRARKISEKSIEARPDVVCEECGKPFKAKRKDVKFCSKDCRRKHAWAIWRESARKREAEGIAPISSQKRICRICGKEFTPFRHNQVCCSKECSAKNFIARTLEERERRVKGVGRFNGKGGVEKLCPICGNSFVTADPNRKYCSVECYQQSVQKRYEERRNPSKEEIERAEHTKKIQQILDMNVSINDGLSEFERVAGMTAREQYEQMRGWSDEKRDEFVQYLRAEGRLKRNIRITAMRSDWLSRQEEKEKVCPLCGKHFVTREPRKRFCSQDCYIVWKRTIGKKEDDETTDSP